jgi:hypothetical protein
VTALPDADDPQTLAPEHLDYEERNAGPTRRRLASA